MKILIEDCGVSFLTVDQDKIRQKLQFMRDSIRLLERFRAMSLEQFLADSINEAAATRKLQVTIEALLDICAHVVAREGWGLPKTYTDTIVICVRNGLISSDMENTYKNMAKFRNRVVHLYDNVDEEEIFHIIKDHLSEFDPFIKKVIKTYLHK